MSKLVTNVPELGALANNLTHSYSDLAAESCRIAMACPSPQVIAVIHSEIVTFKAQCRVFFCVKVPLNSNQPTRSAGILN